MEGVAVQLIEEVKQTEEQLSQSISLNVIAKAKQISEQKYNRWFERFKEEMEKIHGKYAKVCKANGITPKAPEQLKFSAWQTWDTPNIEFMKPTHCFKQLRPPQVQLRAFCFKLKESLTQEYKGKFEAKCSKLDLRWSKLLEAMSWFHEFNVRCIPCLPR
jgi:hypothetical protein